MARRAGPRAPPPARPSRGDGSGPRRATFGEFSGPNLLRPVRGLWAPYRIARTRHRLTDRRLRARKRSKHSFAHPRADGRDFFDLPIAGPQDRAACPMSHAGHARHSAPGGGAQHQRRHRRIRPNRRLRRQRRHGRAFALTPITKAPVPTSPGCCCVAGKSDGFRKGRGLNQQRSHLNIYNRTDARGRHRGAGCGAGAAPCLGKQDRNGSQAARAHRGRRCHGPLSRGVVSSHRPGDTPARWNGTRRSFCPRRPRSRSWAPIGLSRSAKQRRGARTCASVAARRRARLSFRRGSGHDLGGGGFGRAAVEYPWAIRQFLAGVSRGLHAAAFSCWAVAVALPPMPIFR
jgi:hypothetical protein